MAFPRSNKSGLLVGAIVLGLLAVLFLAGAVFASAWVGLLMEEGVPVETSNPEYLLTVLKWRIGMSAGAFCCSLLCWWSYRCSRNVAAGEAES